MTKPTFSLVLNHAPWRPERVECAADMLRRLDGLGASAAAGSLFLHDTDYRGIPGGWNVAKINFSLAQWRWALEQPVTHHVFVTDDLHVHALFWDILEAMVTARPRVPIGLLSNHPRGPRLYSAGHHGYRTNSWLVGPGYVVPHQALVDFMAWFQLLPDGDWRDEPGKSRHALGDDSNLNYWITTRGPGETWHPLPTIIEHRADIETSLSGGDRYSRERLSWRERRRVVEDGDAFRWVSESYMAPRAEDMARVDFWQTEAPMLPVGE